MREIARKSFMSIFLAVLILAAAPASAEVLVQVMSVQDEAAAKKEADRLFDLGIPAFSRAENVPDMGVWNRVYVGPFETEADAKVAADTLQKQGNIKDFVVKSGSAIVVSAPSSTAAGSDVPIVSADPSQTAVGDPREITPFELPADQTPTYGEHVSPEMARELGLSNENRLPTYGEAAPAANGAASSPGLLPPSGLNVGDDMPGLVIQGGATPPANSEVPATSPPATQDTAASPEPHSSAAPLAPSAGDYGEPVLVAQTTFTYNKFDEEHDVVLDRTRDVAGFTMLVDLSSSMRRMSNCPSHIKEEAVASLLRKMNHRIPSKPYDASLRVFGYQRALLRQHLTTLYYGPSVYNRDSMESAIAKLVAADSVSPFGEALRAANEELQSMRSVKAVLMFSDFESTQTSGDPVKDATNLRRQFGQDVEIFTFHVTRQPSAVKLARAIAEAGGGKAYDICHLLNDDYAFENMMMEIFGAGGSACPDEDNDGVCDEDDLCPSTPPGVAVDSRGCWIAAYAQFFDFDKAEVKPEFLPRLQHAANIMKDNPNIRQVVIAGHTDNIGTHDYNMELGRRRAQAVRDLMVQYGISPDRLVIQTYGDTRPIGPNDTAEGRARNRRVEFHIGDMPPKSYQD